MTPRLQHVRLWCIAAADSPTIAVIARVGAPTQTCILRWNWKKQIVEEGSWTSLRIHAPDCALSPDGEFLLYRASGGRSGPFSAEYGGALAISRLPWLSALTDPAPAAVAGGGDSRHALSSGDQRKLWSLFHSDDQSNDAYTPLPPLHMLGGGWTLMPDWCDRFTSILQRRVNAVASQPIAGQQLSLVCAQAPSSSDTFGDRYPDVWNGNFSFFVHDSRSGTPPHRLHDVVWARAYDGGHICVATRTQKLQILRLRYEDDGSKPPKVVQEHDLSDLRPNRRASPNHARAAL
jgi:hypothetical protein